jgi:hypothetical protein
MCFCNQRQRGSPCQFLIRLQGVLQNGHQDRVALALIRFAAEFEPTPLARTHLYTAAASLGRENSLA